MTPRSSEKGRPPVRSIPQAELPIDRSIPVNGGTLIFDYRTAQDPKSHETVPLYRFVPDSKEVNDCDGFEANPWPGDVLENIA